MPSRSLPAEVYGIIAECLVDEKMFESCANLSAVSRTVYGGTLPVLWRTLDLPDDLAERVSDSGLPTIAGDRRRVLQWIINQVSKAPGAILIR